MIPVEEFVALLEKKDLLSPELLAHLRRQVARPGNPISAALIAKWHLGGTAQYHPLRRGFDEFFGFLHEGHFYVPPPYCGATTMLRRRSLPDGSQGRWGAVLVAHPHR